MGTHLSADALTRQLLRAARLEHRISHLIEALQSRNPDPPSPEIERQLELLEQRRAETLEQIIELQRRLEPRARRTVGSGRVG